MWPCPVPISLQHTQPYRSWVGRREVGADRPWPGAAPGASLGAVSPSRKGGGHDAGAAGCGGRRL